VSCVAPVLVVDDDEDIRDSLAMILHREGYETMCAANGKEALQLLRDGAAAPCLILLDLMMPVMDGFRFREEQLIDERLAPIPVVVVTGMEESPRTKALGSVEILGKPFDLVRLLGLVEHHCPQRRPRSQRIRRPGESAGGERT
jgi:CheY-like chemotaxis protein